MNQGGMPSSRFAKTRGRAGTYSTGLQYPSPFFDISQNYLPTTVKDMFKWCRYFFMVHPLINSVVFKMSQYPLRSIVFHTDDDGKKKTWKNFLEVQLQYRQFQEEIGLDFFTYGNGLVSLFYPFIKMLTCKECKHSLPAKDSKYYFRGMSFYFECPKCHSHGEAEVSDQYIRSPRGIRLLRWNPEDIDIQYSDVTGRTTYFYRMPRQLRNDITMGKKHVIEEVPQLFIDALRKKRAIVFSPDNLFHFKRPTLAGKDRGWGMPLVLPVLKDVFYLQVLKKAQESIALEHIVPLRMMFPQSGSGLADAYNSVNFTKWHAMISGEIKRWRMDNNYMPVVPFPVGSQSIGGDGRALLLGQEVRIWSEQILSGMGVPQELIFGGMSYSGSNVSLRMLENVFQGYMQDHQRLLDWVVRSVSAYMDWPSITTSFQPFKMADDLQRQAYYFQLSQAGKISDSTLLAFADIDAREEDKVIQKETDGRADALRKARVSQAEIEGEAQAISMRYQVKAQMEAQQMQMAGQPAPGEPGAEAEGVGTQGNAAPVSEAQAMQGPPQGPPPQPQQAPGAMQSMSSPLNLGLQQPAPTSPEDAGAVNLDLMAQAQQLASYLSQLDPQSRDTALLNIRQQNRELYQLVLGLMVSTLGGDSKNSAGLPLPEQRPPRRGPESAAI